ncbi:MAG: Crp/Fnr family transcriptional regulator [Oscillospiraceae bacterium]|nr:Crp/Fnr family transcriptional regulator [Oscillospiraceae bacterium]
MRKEEYMDALLKRFPPCSKGIDRLFAIGEIRELKKGEILYQQGDTVDQWPILLSGCAKHVGRTKEGKEIVVSIYVSPGDNMIPYDVFLYRPVISQSEIRMTRPGAVLLVPIEKALACMPEEPEIIRVGLASQADYLNWYIHFHFSLSEYRNNLKGLYRHAIETEPELVARASIEDLASFFGVSYYHLSRVRQELKREEPWLLEKLEAYRY